MKHKWILFNEKKYMVLDETLTHYVTPPWNWNENYHFITKRLATVIEDENRNMKEEE